MGMGYYFRSATEHIVFGVKVKMKIKNKTTKNIFNYINPQKLGFAHSAKPEDVRNRIVEWSGDLPRIELFSRKKIDGWDVWGNEVKSDISLDQHREGKE